MCIIVLFLGKQHYDSLWLFQTSLSLYYSSPPSSAFTFLTTPKCSPPPIFWSGHLYLLVPSLLLPNPPILAMVLFYFTGFCSYYRLCTLNWRFGVTALFFWDTGLELINKSRLAGLSPFPSSGLTSCQTFVFKVVSGDRTWDILSKPISQKCTTLVLTLQLDSVHVCVCPYLVPCLPGHCGFKVNFKEDNLSAQNCSSTWDFLWLLSLSFSYKL